VSIHPSFVHSTRSRNKKMVTLTERTPFTADEKTFLHQ